MPSLPTKKENMPAPRLVLHQGSFPDQIPRPYTGEGWGGSSEQSHICPKSFSGVYTPKNGIAGSQNIHLHPLAKLNLLSLYNADPFQFTNAFYPRD